MKKHLNTPVIERAGSILLAIVAVTMIILVIMAAANGNAIAQPVIG